VRTPVCDLLGIDVPIMLAPFGPWEQVELAAAVSNAGGLGGVGTAVRPADELRRQWERLRELTQRPFAINHTGRPFEEEVFAAILDAAPAAISFHMGVPRDRIAEAHDAGALWIQQVGDRRSAELALEAGADVLVAQGWEAGGNAGWVGTLVLVPQVVDAAGEVPVLAAGGIADGRGIAAALALGAH
jgi:enoyl-[acyl-carrier protein] reductase II